MTDTHIDYEMFAGLIEQIEAAATSIDPAQHWRGFAFPIPLSARLAADAFGNTSNGASCRTVWLAAATELTTARDNLHISLEADVGRLRHVMHTFQNTDQAAADDICATTMSSDRLDVYNTHLDSKSIQRREEQARAAVDAVGATPGPTILAGDFNTASSPEVDQLGWNDAATDASGDPIATFGKKSIDKVYTSPGIVSEPAYKIDGGPSDHDGLVVNLAKAPPWGRQ